MNTRTSCWESACCKAEIDVVIVNFNAGAVLIDCVRSVLESKLITSVNIVDNMSTDCSVEMMLEHTGDDQRIFVRRNTYNAGFAQASNEGAANGVAPYVLFLNPDCIIMPGTLERMIDVIDQSSCIGMCGCVIRDPNGREQAGSRRVIPDPWISLGYFLTPEARLPGILGLKRLNLNAEPLPACSS